ncbi:MAG: S1 RNA-binding domain-containing protein [Fibrobacter sp.]|nr:S1 RNA-binding domain-containing protein [Fibrobacter sp.]
MIEFSKQISDKWNITTALSELICEAFEKGDTPYYLSEYKPEIAIELPISTLWEIYDFLQGIEELSTKKKRLLSALKKADKLTPAVERRVNLTTSSFDLDDLMISLRPNPRSKGQLASKKGLDSLADIIQKQEEETAPVEELASSYIGKDPSLKTAEDVIQGVKDILAERFAYDETVRAMAREFAYDDGFIEIIPKNKKDPSYSRYINKIIPVQELTKEEILKFSIEEGQKLVRMKLGVQLFRITELLRHHFILNPDFTGFDLICEAIDDSWMRLLQPIVERDVKQRLREDAEEWACKVVSSELEKQYVSEKEKGPLLISSATDKSLLFLAVNGQGGLLGTTTERKPLPGKNISTERLRQFFSRHKPSVIIIPEGTDVENIKAVLTQAVSGMEPAPEISTFTADTSASDISQSQWMQKGFSTLFTEDAQRKLYGTAIQYLKPISLIPEIGTGFFQVHHLQNLIPEQKFIRIVNRISTSAALKEGISIKEITDSQIKALDILNDKIIAAIRTADAQRQILRKNDLLKVQGISEVIFRNIAGFIIIPGSDEVLDKTLVHPDFFPWFSDICDQLNASIETLVNDPAALRGYSTEDFTKKIYIEKKLIDHLSVGKRFISGVSHRVKRNLKLTEVTEGAIVSGKVTNITPFGVFVNINAVCDGLIHISQLADEYVESPEQVVSVGDRVDVKILKVDVKKRRISLSMKNLGAKGPKVKPSKGQLDNLAEHFKNR